MVGELSGTFAKKWDFTYCKRWRGILLPSCAGKVFGKILNVRLYRHTEVHDLLPEAQAGFRAGRSTTDMVFVLRMVQEISRTKDHPLYVVFGLGYCVRQRSEDWIMEGLKWFVYLLRGADERVSSANGVGSGVLCCVTSL